MPKKIIIFIFFVACLIEGSQWYLYLTTREITKAYFNTDEAGVTWTANINSVTCGVAIIPATVFMDSVKLRTTVLTATGVMVRIHTR